MVQLRQKVVIRLFKAAAGHGVSFLMGVPDEIQTAFVNGPTLRKNRLLPNKSQRQLARKGDRMFF
jgi:hypothetical protein